MTTTTTAAPTVSEPPGPEAAPVRVTIQVTQQDLDDGGRHQAWTDPLSLAMVRTFGVEPTSEWVHGYRYPFVWARHAALPDLTLVALDSACWLQVTRFEMGLECSPYETEIEVPEAWAQRLAAA